MRSQETMFQMWGSQARERLWPCRLESSQCWPTLLRLRRKAAGVLLVLRATLKTKATGRVYCFKAAITVKMVRNLICNTSISLALVCQIARRANQRLTPLRRREKSRRQQAIIDEVRQEILERTRQKTTNAFSQEMQSCKERLPDCATGCVRPGAAPAGRENENRCTGTNVHSASCQLARILLQLDFGLHSSGQRTIL